MNRFSVLFAVAAMLIVVSCGDDPIVIDPSEGINVADGLYLQASGEDPVSAAVLTSESVEDDGFSSQERSGYRTGFMYLAAGDYNIVSVELKEVTDTWGGSSSVVTDAVSDCDYNDYTVVSTEKDGAAFNVAGGFYKVFMDEMTSEAILYKIETAGLIGSATANGWGSDTPLAGTADDTGGKWSATDVTLREGEFKLRFNCRWSIDRRIDPAAGFGADNGYQSFTNFGGSVDNLLPGNDGANIPITSETEGVYTVDVIWDPIDGVSMSLTKTGDVTPITFVPDDHQWAIVGDAINNSDTDGDDIPDGWQTDIDLNYEGFDSTTNTYTWKSNTGGIGFGQGAFKFRTNDSWDENLGWGQIELNGDTADFTDDGGNIKVAVAATYEITMTTSDDGDNYQASFTKL